MKPVIEFRGEDKRTAVVKLYGVIGDYWDDLDAKTVTDAIDAIDADEIVVRINSPGGSVFAGAAIYHVLKRHKATITTEVDGVAASMGSFILMAGKKRRVSPVATIMVHNPFAKNVSGSASELRATADALDKMKAFSLEVYGQATGLTEAELEEMMSATTYMSADEAISKGFATEKITYKDEMVGLMREDTDFRSALFEALNIEGYITGNVEGGNMSITLETVEKEAPDVAKALMQKGRELELERIKGVRMQSVIGHEEMVEKMMFDGVTTGEQAAVAILAVERRVKEQSLLDMKSDSKDISVPATPESIDDEQGVKLMSGVDPSDDDAMKKAWASMKKSDRMEFNGDIEVYRAYLEAMDSGLVRYQKKGR
jgi:ATP-dependent Clp endopeptidase proteolytic subunit ClpP